MSLQERIYSVLIISASEKLNTALEPLLPVSRYSPLRTVKSVSAARRLCNDRSFDFVIINASSLDEDGVKTAIDISKAPGTIVLLIIPSEFYGNIHDKVVGHGVFTLPKPINRQTFITALDFMESAREKIKKMEKKALTFEEKMDEIRLVNRAKWLLISELKMDESQAHRYIEKQAMDKCISKSSVAKDIIKTYS